MLPRRSMLAAREVPRIILMRCGLRNSKNDMSLRFTYHHLSPPPTLNRSESPRVELYKISNCLRGNSVGGRLGVVWGLSAFAHRLPPLHSS